MAVSLQSTTQRLLLELIRNHTFTPFQFESSYYVTELTVALQRLELFADRMSHDETARRRFVQLLGIGVGSGIAISTAVSAGKQDGDTDDEGEQVDEDDGLQTLESNTGFSSTVSRAERAIEQLELALVATIDHAENAASVDLSLPPTTLLIFGNPESGTPLMEASRSIGIDLPQKFLVWEDDGEVFVTYNDPRFLAQRHDIDDMDDQIDGLADTLTEIAEAATGSEPSE